MQINVLVTGATGAVGPALVKLLLKKYNVRVLLHKKSIKGILPDEVEVVKGDINNMEVLNKAVKNVAFVFHLAGMLHINNPDFSLGEKYFRVNVDGTKNVVEASRLMGVKRVIIFSTISVYGNSYDFSDDNFSGYNFSGSNFIGKRGYVHGIHTKVFDETTPVNFKDNFQNKNLYAQTKYKAEQAVEHVCNSDGKPLVTILRLASVYGSCMKGNYPKLLKAVTKGWFVFVGSGKNRRTMVCDKDVARAALLVASHPKACGEVYNITDNCIYTFDDILNAVYKVFHRPVLKIYLSESFIRRVIKLASDITSYAGIKLSVKVSMVDKLVEDVAVCGDKIFDKLGFRPKYNIINGWLEPEYRKRQRKSRFFIKN